MSLQNSNNAIKRLQNHYRLVVMNDDTYEEVVTFKLSRLSVYIGMSTLFVVLVSCTVALLAFTPLKYYIPGYGSRQAKTELQILKYKTDSLEQAILYKDRYLNSIKKVLEGNTAALLDTTALQIEPIEQVKD
jgi:hypothetical protein